MYKTETHLHVSEVSPCSKLTAEEMVGLYHKAGYKTIFVSDHFQQNVFDKLGDMKWEEKITYFLSGYCKAKSAGEKRGMNVLMSAEIRFDSSPNHYLVYGITKEFLCKYPNLYEMEPSGFYEIVKANNIFVVQAHPFRDDKCYPTPEYIDAIEIYNSNPRHEDHSEKSEVAAKENGLFMTAGSDAHRPDDVGLSGILTENEIKNATDYINTIKNGAFEIIRG